MLLNHLKIALRSMTRSKLPTLINLLGLALAMASALLIYLFINDEVKFDTYHAKADRTYRVVREFLNTDGSVNLGLSAVAAPIGPLLKNDFGEVEVTARTHNWPLAIRHEEDDEVTKVFFEEKNF